MVLNTGGIPAQNIGIDIVIGQKADDKVTKTYMVESLNLVNVSGVKATYTCSVNPAESGVFDFAFRIYPKNDVLPHRQDFNLIKWI
jgi:hypothetical protein